MHILLNLIQKFGIWLLGLACVLLVIFIIRYKNDIDKRMFFCSVVVLCACLFVSIFVIQFTHVESGSMEPTIMTGDYTVVNKLAYLEQTPERGDLIAFKSDELGLYLLKRVIGLPGDKIEFREGFVYINDSLYNESAYLVQGTETNCTKTFYVPEESYFVMGDNREHSTDSRFFKMPYISQKNIMGKVIYVFRSY